jgi:hypothetical protein
MSAHVPAAVAVGIILIVLPVIIVRAQAEGETEVPPSPAAETIGEPAADTTGAEQTEPQESEATAPTEEEGSVLGAETSTEAVSGSEPGEAGAPDTTSEPATAGDASADPVGPEAASTTAAEFLALDTASSTASSTAPIADPPAEAPKEEPFVLQPAVTLHTDGSLIAANIELQNLTCKACEKVLPAAEVKAYYTAWYPNDGPELKEVGERLAEQEVGVSDVALWSSRAMTWSASDVAPGRYYFVIVVDPENAIGAYRMQRMEFAI